MVTVVEEGGAPPALLFRDLAYTIPEQKSVVQKLSGRFVRKGASESDVEEGRVVKGSEILKGISGCISRGEAMAIIGPSGAGKSSLLNLLAARSAHPPSSGTVEFDGAPRQRRTRRSIGYVMQDDVFFTRLTVRETLGFTAAVRGANTTAAERKEKVDSVVRKLRLEKCLDTRIGDQQFDKGISGGERKRVNLANELLAQPEKGILLLDEPTSGLDSTSALAVVRLLRNLADDGHAIVATIHQPTATMLRTFDTVLFLCEGEVVYFGPTASTEAYFESIAVPFPQNENPADFIMQLMIDDDILAPKELVSQVSEGSSDSGRPSLHGTDTSGSDAGHEPCRKYLTRRWRKKRNAFWKENAPAIFASLEKESSRPHLESSKMKMVRGPQRAVEKRARQVVGRPDSEGLPDKYNVGWWTQVRVLSLRSLRQKRGAILDRVQLSQLAIITLISALFWFRMERTEATLDDRLGALFFFNVFFSFFSTFQALFAFPAERAVLNKDRASGAYRLSAYYFAKTCVEMPADTAYPLVFSLVTYYMIGLNSNFTRFLVFLVILVFVSLTSQGLGLMVSAAVMDVRKGQVICSALILSFMLLGGYYVDSDNIPVFLRPFGAVSHIKYGYVAFVRNEIRGQEFPCVGANEPSTVFSGDREFCPIDDTAILRGAQLENTPTVLENIAILFGLMIALRLAGYLALKYLHRPYKQSL